MDGGREREREEDRQTTCGNAKGLRSASEPFDDLTVHTNRRIQLLYSPQIILAIPNAPSYSFCKLISQPNHTTLPTIHFGLRCTIWTRTGGRIKSQYVCSGEAFNCFPTVI